MSGTDDLRDLLDRLKDEVGPVSDAPPRAARRPAREFPGEPAAPSRSRAEDLPRRPRYDFKREEPGPRPSGGTAWAENKESMLFGTLTSLIAALGGILGGVEYLVYMGAAGFVLFSAVTLYALIGHLLNSARRRTENAALEERVDALSRRLETLSLHEAEPGERNSRERQR